MITILLFVALHKPVSGDEMFVLYEDLPGPQSDDLQSQWYRSAGRQIRRLEAIIPGPINAIYSETVAGTAVIRAFGVQSVFISGGSFIYTYVLVHLFDEAEKIGALMHVYPPAELLRTINMRTTAQMWRLYVARWLFSETLPPVS